MNAIEVNSLTKKFSNFKAIDNISFNVKEGEIFGFLGPNGAGKSTTMMILTTLLKPTSGKALVGGYNVVSDAKKVRDIRQRFTGVGEYGRRVTAHHVANPLLFPAPPHFAEMVHVRNDLAEPLSGNQMEAVFRAVRPYGGILCLAHKDSNLEKAAKEAALAVVTAKDAEIAQLRAQLRRTESQPSKGDQPGWTHMARSEFSQMVSIPMMSRSEKAS